MSVVADNKTINSIGDSKCPPPKLKCLIPPKPLRLLNTLATQNLTLKEAASALHMSVHTANKHIAVAKEVLNTSTLANAVYLATKQGLIEITKIDN